MVPRKMIKDQLQPFPTDDFHFLSHRKNYHPLLLRSSIPTKMLDALNLNILYREVVSVVFK